MLGAIIGDIVGSVYDIINPIANFKGEEII